MNRREHITDDNRHQAEATPYRGATASEHYMSPAYRRWAEQIERDARPPADTFTMPTTAAELNTMDYADRVRVNTTDPALYDRLTDRTPA